MKKLHEVDLSANSTARRYVKSEVVTVKFAEGPGIIASREGRNRYATGDALITGSTGDHWSVSRDRFDAKYTPVPPLAHGHNGSYKNRPLPVLALQVHETFCIERVTGGDLLHGNAGDWLMQYAPGDYGIVEDAKFRKVYRAVDETLT